MTTKPTDTKTPDTEELKDADLDKVQGGWSWGETNEGALAKGEQKKPSGASKPENFIGLESEGIVEDKDGKIRSQDSHV